ncbi:AAA family ATPase [Promineifilum sp.]|uniref:AAA family ATPase n=1 Tax=Promineifilum sp. TaxID=2664178 RepID=UPI0035B0A42E
MIKANVSRQALVEAIATLESQRGAAGENHALGRAVDVALQALRDKLVELQSNPDDRQQRSLTVLVADLSGFTALSERMDAENVRDAMNAMWQVLDAVIRDWGGQIDQHAGDSLLALFGLPQPRRGDAVRALHAALALQEELALFNARVRQAAADQRVAWAGEWPGPQMRVGVHSGPVYFARPPGGDRPKAVGDTVAIARRLERLAPVGQVLASPAVQRPAQPHFHLSLAAEALPDAARRPGEEAYLVAAARTDTTAFTPDRVAGGATRLVGRTEELDRLELALQAAIDSRTPQLVTVIGPSGSGKSRLIHEFEGRARLLTGSLTVLHAGTQSACPDAPYALARELLLRRFRIRPQHSRYLIEAHIRRGLRELERPAEGRRPATGPLPGTLHLLEQLLDVRTAAAVPVEEALAVVARLLGAITAGGPALVVLDGVERADRESLALLDRLVREAAALPVLFLAQVEATPAVGTAAIQWLAREDGPFAPFDRLTLAPLSPVESRLMAGDILAPLGPPPMRLLDLVVAESGGLPLYIEAFIRLLIERGLITTGERWRVDMAGVEGMALPAGLPALLRARLQLLPEAEQAVLCLASVMGPLFWDAALPEMAQPALNLSEPELEAALLSLEMKRYITASATYSFGANQAYTFWRESMRRAAYTLLPPEERRAQHQRVARWLIAHRQDTPFGAWFPVDVMIARHFADAGDDAQADAWQRRAPGSQRFAANL